MNIFKRLTALSMLLVAVPVLGQDVKSLQGDMVVKKALESAPLLTARLQAISAEWRSVEADVEALKHDKNFLSRLASVPRLLRDAGRLEQDTRTGTTDPALIAEIQGNAVLSAHLDQVTSEWQAVESALHDLKTG